MGWIHFELKFESQPFLGVLDHVFVELKKCAFNNIKKKKSKFRPMALYVITEGIALIFFTRTFTEFSRP